jgi:RNA polymerase sigma-70 factor (ECF subfamily)
MDLNTDVEPAPPASEALTRQIIAALYPGLRRLAGVVADPDMDADDLVHDAVVGWLRRPPGQVREPGAYLRRAVVNAAERERRSRARGRSRELRATGRPGEPVTAQYPSDVGALLDCLAPADRALLYVLDVEGAPVAEAAAVVGLSVVAARARASRARRAARRRLEGEGR